MKHREGLVGVFLHQQIGEKGDFSCFYPVPFAFLNFHVLGLTSHFQYALNGLWSGGVCVCGELTEKYPLAGDNTL